MREIKFRGWDGTAWRYGDFVHATHGRTLMWDLKQRLHFNVDPDTVGQFTGMKDADGREIYEGDVLRGHAGAAGVIESEVAFYAGAFRFSNNHLTLEYCLREIDDAKVIGNVHDNPDLLEKQS